MSGRSIFHPWVPECRGPPTPESLTGPRFIVRLTSMLHVNQQPHLRLIYLSVFCLSSGFTRFVFFKT